MAKYCKYFVVLLAAALSCSVTTSNSQTYSQKPCHDVYKTSTYEETEQGRVLQGLFVNCALISQEIGIKFMFDINWALNAAEVYNNTLVQVSILFWCKTPIELEFINPWNTTNKNILLALSFKGECKVWAQNIAVFAKATDFRGIGLTGSKVTWSSAPAITNSTNLTQGNGSLVEDLKEIALIEARESFLENLPDLFTNSKSVWPNMAEIDFEQMSIKKIPEQWKTTMPRLQQLRLVHCNLTKPPDFPWNNSTLKLYRGLKRIYGSALQMYEVKKNIYVRELNLNYNNIQDLTSHEFRGFLHVLSIWGNGLRAIGPSCFHNLKGIQKINLGKNNLTNLPHNLFQGLTSLLTVILAYNKLQVIGQNQFEGLEKIKAIFLNDNNLNSIPKGLFSSLNTLEYVHLATNNITKIEENPFPENSALRWLYLNENKLTSFPPWIFRLRNIKEISLADNRLTFEDLNKALDDFTVPLEDPSTKSPIVLNLSNNNITALIDSTGLNMIKRVNIISPIHQAKYTYLWKAYKITLSGNPLACDCIMSAVAQEIRTILQTHPSIRARFDTWRCHWPHELKKKSILAIGEDQWMQREERDYHNCPAECTCLTRCSNGVIVVDCEKKNLTKVPSSMPRGLVELNLMSNDIRDIPAYPYLVNVTVLKLTNNKIERLESSTVEKMKHVEILFIDSNNLTTLPREIESLNFTTLALDQNLFKCDCTTKWMKNWLVKNKGRIKNIEKVLCHSAHALGQPIYNVPDDEFICSTTVEKNDEKAVTIETIAAATLGGLLVLMVIVAIILYKYHREVKVFMYTHFNWHPFDRIDDSDPSKIYDAFISYSGNDFHWVVNTLQAGLENHFPPYKLCFHHRDFKIAIPIVENILTSVDQSKRMLVVLSPSYAQSEWCLMEFREAHRKVLADRMKYLIIILLGDVDTTELDEEVKAYLRTNTYVSAADKWFWQKLFYAMPLPSRTESVEDRSHQSIATRQDMNTSVEILEELQMETAHNTADTIELVQP